MRFSRSVRLGLIAAVVVLLFAPLSQALDRHDHFTPHDTELNLCVLAAVASAGIWAFRPVLTDGSARPRPRIRRPAARHVGRLALRPPAPPLSPPLSLRR